MKTIQIIFIAFCFFNGLFAQEKQAEGINRNGLKMETQYSSENEDLRDVLSFEGIDYMKLRFTGKELVGKSYKLTVKEIWDGQIVSDTTVIDSKSIGIEEFQTLNDSIFKIKIISKLTSDNKLKMTFHLPQFRITKKFDAIESEDYSLRNLADESNLEIGYNEKFYLLGYILPYEREDGSKSWCDVGTAGDSIEEWGKKFGIKHYLLFEMIFE